MVRILYLTAQELTIRNHSTPEEPRDAGSAHVARRNMVITVIFVFNVFYPYQIPDGIELLINDQVSMIYRCYKPHRPKGYPIL